VLIGGLPVYLVGATSVVIGTDLAFDARHLGLAFSGYYAAAALCGLRFGRLVDRFGGRRTLVLAAGLGSLNLCVLAGAWSWAVVAVCLIFGGMINSLAQLGSNLRVNDEVAAGRLGLALAFKQAAAPGATLLAGVAVPLVALTLGWRWVFGIAGVAALGTALLQLRGRGAAGVRTQEGTPGLGPQRGILLALAVACFFGAISLVCIGSFFVPYATSIGMPAGPAGIVLAVGSLGAIVVRLLMGWRADRRPGRSLLYSGGLLVCGGLALTLLPFVTSWIAIALVLLVALAAGTGWPGLVNLAVIRMSPQAPAMATSVTFTGSSLGCVVGPTGFGFIVSLGSYRLAWLSAAAFLVLSGAMMLVARRRARQIRARLSLVVLDTTASTTAVVDAGPTALGT
jgi:MFS family permease